jgi:pre-mRNA-processing factor 40
VDNLRTKEAEEKDARLAKLRPALRNLLKGNPNIFPYTTFPTADRLFKTHPIWQQGKIEAERKLVFEEYVAELKDREIVRIHSLSVRKGIGLTLCFFRRSSAQRTLAR